LIKYYRTPVKYDRKSYGLDEAIKKIAKYNILAMTDPDGISKKDWLVNLVQPFKNKKVGAVIGLTHCGNFYKNLFTMIRAIEDEWLYVIYHLGRIFKKEVHFICGANYAVRKQALESVNYHGKKTLAEDLELSIQLYSKGWKIKVTEAEVWQEEVHSIRSYIRQRLRWHNATIKIFNVYKKEIKDILDKRPFAFIFAILSFPIQIYSLLSVIFMILSLVFSLNIFIINLISFLIFNLVLISGLIRFKKSHLILHVPLFLLFDGIFMIYCFIRLHCLKFLKKRIVWRSLNEGFYHRGDELILK
jgi:cellulose synthase/poly-beta-1,6-N-acetylglucosamine synthase-like glycosyltransferase